MGIQLKDVSIRTMIGQLPKILNDNNDSISDYFDKIYDSDNDRIIKSVYNPLGSVKAHLGEFREIQVDNLVINDSYSKQLIVHDIEHNLLSDRYLYNDNGSVMEISDISLNQNLKQYCHNAGAIGIEMADGDVLSIAQVINDIIKQVSAMKGYHNASGENVTTLDNDTGVVSIYGASRQNLQLSEPNSFTFDNSILFANKVQLKRMNLPEYQFNDIASGFIYTYYDYANTVTISDEHTASLKGIPGSTINIKFNDTKKKGFYRILLSRSEKKYLRISKDELIRLTLICIDNDDINGTTWDVKDYSVRNADDLVIERK